MFHEDEGAGREATARVARLLAPFARRTGDKDPARAILAAYPGTTLPALDDRLRRYAAYMTAKRGNTVLAYPFAGHEPPALRVTPADRDLVRGYAQALRAGRLPTKM